MLSEKMQNAINDQVNFEIFSAHIYLSMVAYFEEQGLSGFAKWMRAQYQEEIFHAMKMFDYVLEAGGSAKLGTIDAPPLQWESPLAAFENALEHEQIVTGRINALMELAQEEKDHATQIFLQWFVSEQVEEEASVGEVVGKLRLAGDGGALFMLDRDLSARVFTPPAE
ncbi:ferritin [Pseudodesulfovibrio senegalensis]|jgi:ferritin|uniref:Ferritin n=1 Tax=Pseudodesulfovibrio senegalensis TaxID=1721087 RepID=A0A6N6N7U3_9BACT|nr:ferritin [Pseudodesulfovibrio senegalensis]KAB1443728.1 ferritin [Pseudodesulfovibrio senegalensis]